MKIKAGRLQASITAPTGGKRRVAKVMQSWAAMLGLGQAETDDIISSRAFASAVALSQRLASAKGEAPVGAPVVKTVKVGGWSTRPAPIVDERMPYVPKDVALHEIIRECDKRGARFTDKAWDPETAPEEDRLMAKERLIVYSPTGMDMSDRMRRKGRCLVVATAPMVGADAAELLQASSQALRRRRREV